MGKLQIPKLPVFKTILPSNGLEVEYRPITVKEESFLLISKETTPEDVSSSIRQIIKNCTTANINQLTEIDVEWLFLKIRMKSVSDEIELQYRCTSVRDNGKICNASFSSIIDLNAIEIVGEKEISLKLSFVSGDYVLWFAQPFISQANEVDESRILYSMVKLIEQPNGELLTHDDISFEEFEEFISTFTNSQADQLRAAISQVPKLYYKDTLICPICKTKNEIEYKGLSDFFGF